MEKRLSEFSIGETGVIRLVGGDGKIRRRLFDMGVTPGAEEERRCTSARSPRSAIPSKLL